MRNLKHAKKQNYKTKFQTKQFKKKQVKSTNFFVVFKLRDIYLGYLLLFIKLAYIHKIGYVWCFNTPPEKIFSPKHLKLCFFKKMSSFTYSQNF